MRVLWLATRAPTHVSGVEIRHVAPLQIVPRHVELKRALDRLESWRAVAFASVHAVDALLGALIGRGREPAALAGARLCAVGEGTAERLVAHGLPASIVAEGGGAELAAAMLAGGVTGPVLVPRAAEGRAELCDALVAAGVAVDTVIAYDALVDTVALEAAAAEHRARPFDAIAFASPRGAAAFLAAVGGAAGLGTARLGAIGATTAEALPGLHVRLPDAPRFDALLAALLLPE
jgi:uroporphyrinogen-III synthase